MSAEILKRLKVKFGAFLTGSQVYGEPGPESDIDLVIRCSPEVEAILKSFSDDPTSSAIRFGKLNIISCRSDHEYGVWDSGTKELISKREDEGRPITRDEAKAVFSTYRGQSE